MSNHHDEHTDHHELEEQDPLVRPYTLTGGRTTSDASAVPVEAIVRQTPGSADRLPPLGPVEGDIWEAAGDGQSSFELSARLGLPLGVVRVLVGDLAGGRLVDVGQTADNADVALVRRLIDGVNAL